MSRIAGGGRAILTLNTPGCFEEASCFEVAGSTDPTDLANGVYVPVQPLESKGLTQSLADMFASVPANFDLAGRCYDLTTLDIEDLQTGNRCAQNVFLTLDAMSGTKDYKVLSPGDGKTIAIPFGWKYVSRVEGWGQNQAHILQSAQDIMNEQSHTTGWNVGLQLLYVDFSVSHNETTKSRIEDMYDKSLTYSQFDYIETEFALVVDKANAQLDPDFYRMVTEASREATPDFTDLIKTFGTHYAFATTMGQRGSLTSTISSENVQKLHDQSVDVSTAVSVGVTVPIAELGEAKASAGFNTGSSNEDFSKMASTLGEDFGEYHCVGGMSCNGQSATAGGYVPVLLDLRPLSDLLGPPFFPEIDNLDALRAAYAQGYRRLCLHREAASPEAAAKFLEVSALTYGCSVDSGGTNIGSDVSSDCTMAGITLKDAEHTMGFTDGPHLTMLTSNDLPIVVPVPSAAGAAQLTASGMVTRPKADCSVAANNGHDQTPVSGIASGSAAVPAPSATGPTVLNIEMADPHCHDEAGGRYVTGGAGVSVNLVLKNAADLLSH